MTHPSDRARLETFATNLFDTLDIDDFLEYFKGRGPFKANNSQRDIYIFPDCVNSSFLKLLVCRVVVIL